MYSFTLLNEYTSRKICEISIYWSREDIHLVSRVVFVNFLQQVDFTTQNTVMNIRGLFYEQISQTTIGIMEWINNYIHVKQGDMTTHPCPKFNGGFAKRRWSNVIDDELRHTEINGHYHVSISQS